MNHKWIQQFSHSWDYYSSISKQYRILQLSRIFKQPPNSHSLKLDISKYPIQQIWQYNLNKYATYYYPPKNSPKALLILLNGIYGYHSCSYAQAMANNGILVATYDYINFGGSQGIHRGKLQQQATIIDTTSKFIKHVQNEYDLPTFIQGVNLGGTIALLLGNHKIRGSILINPILSTNPLIDSYANLKLILGMILPNYQLYQPQYQLLSNYDIKPHLTQQKQYCGNYFQTKMMMVKAITNPYTLPYLFIQGATDKVNNVFQIIDYHNKSKSNDKTAVIIEQMWHIPQLTTITNITKQWIQERI